MTSSDDRRGALPPPAPGATLVPPAGNTVASVAVTRVLGGRYEIRGVLGRGGMGEVWLARDLKLQVEVALKAVAPEKLGDEGAIARLRAEVRSARAVASPHVCRVYDLIEAEGLECVSMEYVDGTTLRRVLETRSPLPLEEAREIALQLLAGLGAIHEAGLVHRDVKPENVMLTRAGRVVLMDFGIAKAVASGGTVAGTPAYWAPEQAMGAPADPRADVYASGIVLAEMVAPSGVRDSERRQALWQGLREDPPSIPDTPWLEAIARAVARDPDRRYASAQALARALEEIAHRVSGVEEAQPYPGLSAFTEADAEYFFGREAEVEEAWKRLPGRHLLALVGPSGAGKSSFLRAGLIPAKPEGWAHLVCTPGDAPFVALGQALVPEVSRDTDAMRQMLRFEDADVAVSLFRRWRSDHTEALVIVDQFEELFTLNPEDVQLRFASLLSRLVLEADVHALLSIRDDFLLRCQAHEGLRPIFEGLMPLGAPTGDALRRALVQPALKCGYRFEDEALVAEMLQAVEGERGALPLLAFAAASLWERRDRTQGVLTRGAHHAIGGVAGALAQHAEATLERIGTERLPLVRELFRNLVTAEGTRAVRDVGELLTVFPEGQRADAEQVLKTLIDARLLTSYEAHAVEPGQRAGRRVEVVHESLLSAWPRLVRWRTEDEGSAQLRDQLRQAAHLWEEKGKPDDLIWTGTSYQEYQVWRSRYPGGLSETEETFAKAMTAKARRRKRLIRAAAATVVLISTGVTIAIGVSRHQAVLARERAEAEARRAEAGKLLALARVELDRYPTAALAYARKSLELFDTPEARRFAIEVLWRAPVARILPADRIGKTLDPPVGPPWGAYLSSPDGHWLPMLAAEGHRGLLFPWDGGAPIILKGSRNIPVGGGFGPGNDFFIQQGGQGQSLQFFSLPDLREIRRVDLGGVRSDAWVRGTRLVILTWASPKSRYAQVRVWPLPWGEPELVGEIDWDRVADWTPDAQGRWLVYARGHTVFIRGLGGAQSWQERVLGVHPNDVGEVFPCGANGIVSIDAASEIRIWSLNEDSGKPLRVLQALQDAVSPTADGAGTYVACALPKGEVQLWNLRDAPDVEPVVLKRPEILYFTRAKFEGSGRWLVSNNGYTVAFWPVSSPWRRVLANSSPGEWELAFTPDSRWLVACDKQVRVWPLHPEDGAVRALPGTAQPWHLALDPAGTHVLTVPFNGKVLLSSIRGGPPRELHTPWEDVAGSPAVAFDIQGRRAAACPWTMRKGLPDPSTRAVRVWDLESGREQTFSLAHLTDASWRGCDSLRFGADGSLYAAWSSGGVFRLVLPDEPSGRVSAERLYAAEQAGIATNRDGRQLLVLAGHAARTYRFEELLLFNLAAGTSHRITTHGDRLQSAALDPSGRVLVTGDIDGVVRVGTVAGEEPHLLLGHATTVSAVAVSPDGRWIASDSDEGHLLWPMPDLSKPPLQTLVHDDLIAKLDALTNLRVVRDPSSSTGWKLDVGPFPGWKDVPEWNP
jgi:WD40 repeat protein